MIGNYIVDFYIAEAKIVIEWMVLSIMKMRELERIKNGMRTFVLLSYNSSLFQRRCELQVQVGM